MLVRVVVFLAPLVVSTAVGLATSSLLPRPRGLGATIVWWSAVVAASLGSGFGFDRLFRLLLPLSVLLDLALVFPGVAPSRFSTAFRGGTVRHLQRRVEQAKEDGTTATTAESAATVVELVAALAAHDPGTRGHVERTRAYSELIAEELGLAQADRELLRWSALLHDIGKLHVKPSLLNKPTSLDEEEWETLRRHPAEGALIAGSLHGWLGTWGLAIEQHHERFDGTGYPRALAGTDISLGGRIVAVADAYEVMTSARSYAPPVTPAAAREELVRCAGRHFDPDVVRAFLRIAIGRLPRATGLLVGLAGVPGLLKAQRLLAQSATAAAAGGAFVGLVAGGIIAPGGGLDRPFERDRGPEVRRSPAGPGERPAARTAIGSADGVAEGGADDGSATATDETVAASPIETVPPSAPAAAPAPAPAPVPTTGAAVPAPRPPASSSRYFLGGSAPGTRASPANLSEDRPGGSGAPDYDGDGSPGRTLAPTPKPGTTDDLAEHQLWVGRFPSAVTLTGAPRFTVSSATAGFTSERGNLRAFLLDCDADGRACAAEPIATASRNEADWGEGSSTFVTKTLTFSAVDHPLAAGRTLVLRVGAQMGSAPLLLAYGTDTHPSALDLDLA